MNPVVATAALALALAAGSLGTSAFSTSSYAQAPAACSDDDPIVGTTGDDKLNGTSGDDVLIGRKGDDVIRGRGGNDVICGRGGDDLVKGGSGNDTILGGAGDDELRGGPGDDTITGGSGFDTIDGGVAFDTCDGESETNCEEATPSPSPSASPSPTPSPSQSATPTPTPTATSSPTPTPPPGNPPQNLKPTAADDDYDTKEDQTLSVPAPGVLGNDSDPENNLQSATLLTPPASGDVTLNANGSFTYEPDPDSNGPDTFTYAAHDGVQQSDPATVTVDVDPVDDAPEAIAQSVSTNEDDFEVVTLFGSDVDGTAPSVFKITSVPSNGDVREGSGLGGTLIGAGDVPYTLSGNTVTYVPDPNYSGPDSFDFKANDGALDSDPAAIQVTVLPVNDPPTDISLSNDSVDEELPAGATVGNLSAADPDPGDAHAFNLAAGAGDADNGRFTIVNGVLKTDEVFDFETQGPFSIRVRAVDGSSAFFEKQFSVTLNDVNDTPVVTGGTFSLPENSANGTSVGTPSVADQDAGQTHTWSITGGNTGGAFQIDPSTGAITVADADDLDFETAPSFSLTVRAEDDGSPAKHDSDTATVNLTNVNEAPTDVNLSGNSVAENEASGTDVGNLSTVDPDSGDTHTYHLVSGTGDGDNGKFQITNGVLETAQSFDFETQGPFSVRIETRDAGNLTHAEVFSISVSDVNDAPVVSPATVSLDENSANGTAVHTVIATDDDQPAQDLTYSITGGNALGAFQIDADTGAITVADTTDLDYETNPTFNLTVRATDDGSPAKDGSDTITINLDDLNEAPVVNSATLSLAENAPNGTSVGTATFNDQDSGQTHTFAITGGNTGGAFQINPSTGEITVADSNDVDFETNPSFSLTVEVTDDGAPASSGSNTVTVDLTNVNESPTDIFLNDTSVAENASINTVVGTISGTDPDAGDSAGLTFSLAAGAGDTDNARFNVGPSNSLRTSEVFDKETQGPFSIRLRATDGGNQYEETFSITIDDVNETPDVNAATFSLAENSANGTSVGTATFTDPDAGQTHTFAITGGNTGGAFQINPSTGEITVADTNDVDFETNPSFGLTVEVTDDGTPQLDNSDTVTVNLNDVNDNPVVNAATFSVAENSADGTSVGTVTASDEDSPAQTMTWAITGGNTGDAFGINPSTGEIRVADTSDVDFETNHPFSLTVEATDSGVPSRSGSNTITINLTNVNEAPVITAPSTVSAQYEVAKAISGISVADPDAGGNDLAMTLSVLDGTLTLDTSVVNGVVAGDVTGNGTDALTVSGTQSEINNTLAAANGLTYTSDAGFAGLSDTLAIAVNDNGNTGSGSPQADAENVTIQFNGPPVATAQTVSTDEDTEKTVTLAGTDPDNDPLTFKITSLPAAGKLHEGTSSAGTEITAGALPYTLPADKVTYVPPLNQSGTGLETFGFKARDGSTDSAEALVTVDVSPVNDAPDLTIGGSNLDYDENDPPEAITSSVTLDDVDNPMLSGATVQITGNYANGQDVLAYPGGFSITANPFDAGTGTLTLTGTTTLANYIGALEAVTYENTSHNPSELTRTVTFTVTDGALSDTATAGIDVTEINDVPVVSTPGGDLSYTENDAPTAIHPTMTATDADHTNATGATVQITGNYQNGEDVLSFVNSFGVTAAPFDASTGTLTLSGTTTFANYENALRSVKYHNTSEDPSALTRTVTFSLSDGEGQGTGTRGIAVTPVNDAPVADIDVLNNNKSALANTTLDNGVNSTEPIHIDTASNENILDGDFDHEGDTFSLVAGADCTGVSAPFTCTTDQGGTVTLGSGGLFEYDPPAGYTGTDSFQYRISDNQPVNPTSDGTVNINVVGPLVWYVDDSAPGGGNGTSSSMFQGLAPLSTGGGSDSKDGTGDRIFVHSGTYANGIVLENNQKLIGQPNGFSVQDSLSRTHNLLAAGGTNPAISHTGNTVVALGSGNEIQDVALGDGTVALAGTSVGTATVKDSSINAVGKALDINGGNLDMTFTNVSSSNSGSEAIKLNNATGTFTASTGTLQNATNAVVDINDASQTFTYGGNISDNGGQVISITNTDGGTKEFNGTISGGTGGSSARINLTNNGPSVMRFTNDLALNTGAQPAFNATGGGTVHVTSDDNVLSTTTGIPLTVVNTTIGAGDLIFDSITSNGAANGIVLDNTGNTGNLNVTGTGPANSGGTIANTSGADAATNQCAKPSGQPAGSGILLKDTSGVILNDMLINGSSNFGLLGHDVNGFTMVDTVFSGTHGTNDGQDEGTVMFCDLTGSASVTTSTIGGGFENGFTVKNTGGTLNPLTVSDSNFATSTGALGDDAFHAAAFGNATMNVTINNDSDFTTAGGDLLNYILNNTSTGTLTLTGNDFTNNHPGIASGGGGITVAAGGGGSNTNLDYTITDNDMRDALGNGLTITTGVGNGAGDYDGTVSNNRIGVAGVPNSGSAQADGLAFNHEGSGTHTASVTGNTIVQYANGYGIGLRPQGTTGSPMRVTIQNNTISNPGTFAISGIGVDIASTSTTLCLNIGGVGAEANSISTSNGSFNDDINILTNAASNTINLPGYVGGAKDATAVQTFLASRNAGNGPATAFADTTGSFGNGGSNCL
jgi:hypothetical protein